MTRLPICILMLAGAARAATPSWSDGGAGGVNGTVRALSANNDAGPIGRGLFVGGSFSTVGLVPATNIARWDGSAWTAFGSGVGGEVRAILPFDPDADGPLTSMLVVGGAFSSAGGVQASRIAAWNGSAWSPLGVGANGTVNALAEFDPDGSGPMPTCLYVGGAFTEAGGVPAANIARWYGSAWSAVGDASSEVLVIRAIDPAGEGNPSLAVGGWFTSIGGITASRVAVFTGTEWSALGQGLGGMFPVLAQSIEWFDSLHVGGFFSGAGAVNAQGLTRWDGSAWSAVQGGVGYPAEARAMVVLDDDGAGPNPPRLFVAGNYVPDIGGPGNNIAAWDGVAWHPLGVGTNLGVWALASFDEDGAGPDPAALFVGGEFTLAGGVPVARFARWGVPRTTQPMCPDANLDGAVNFTDITIILANFNSNYAPGTGLGDANRDGAVTFADITAVLSGWGMHCQ